MFLIQTWGGIGDILRELSALPHATLHRRIGLQWEVTHIPPESQQLHPEAQPPSTELARQLVERCPSLQWRGTGSWTTSDKIWHRLWRFLARQLSGNRRFSPEIRLTEEEEADVPLMNSPLRIGLQTHLQGLPSKRWDIAQWSAIVENLLSTYPGSVIYILDPAEQSHALVTDTRVVWCGGLNLPQSIRMVEQLHLLVSIDSWTKYVAAWARVPQVVIVPDQSSDYRELDADTVWTHSFAGLAGKPEVTLLGLEKKSGHARYTLPRLSDLRSEDVLAAITARAALLRGLRVTSTE